VFAFSRRGPCVPSRSARGRRMLFIRFINRAVQAVWRSHHEGRKQARNCGHSPFRGPARGRSAAPPSRSATAHSTGQRIEIELTSGRRIIVDVCVDVEALARRAAGPGAAPDPRLPSKPICLELLILGPASPSTRVHHFEPFDLGTLRLSLSIQTVLKPAPHLTRWRSAEGYVYAVQRLPSGS
jgi:hypothetical protein